MEQTSLQAGSGSSVSDSPSRTGWSELSVNPPAAHLCVGMVGLQVSKAAVWRSGWHFFCKTAGVFGYVSSGQVLVVSPLVLL